MYRGARATLGFALYQPRRVSLCCSSNGETIIWRVSYVLAGGTRRSFNWSPLYLTMKNLPSCLTVCWFSFPTRDVIFSPFRDVKRTKRTEEGERNSSAQESLPRLSVFWPVFSRCVFLLVARAVANGEYYKAGVRPSDPWWWLARVWKWQGVLSLFTFHAFRCYFAVPFCRATLHARAVSFQRQPDIFYGFERYTPFPFAPIRYHDPCYWLCVCVSAGNRAKGVTGFFSLDVEMHRLAPFLAPSASSVSFRIRHPLPIKDKGFYFWERLHSTLRGRRDWNNFFFSLSQSTRRNGFSFALLVLHYTCYLQ